MVPKGGGGNGRRPERVETEAKQNRWPQREGGWENGEQVAELATFAAGEKTKGGEVMREGGREGGRGRERGVNWPLFPAS